MISCTEFIPAYSEGFKFLENKGSRSEVEKFWSYLSDLYVKDRLGKFVAEEGLEGCYTYWTETLNEEAADFKIIYDEIKGEYKSYMYKCPSKGMLNELTYMEPYHAYCEHCPALYGPVLKKLGYKYEKDLSRTDEAYCTAVIKAY
jgi:hypothetical protein